MADFKEALNKTLIQEGFYNNLAKDTGGETYCGISRRNFPDWEGWKAVDHYKSEFGMPQFGQEIPQADKYVEDFYSKNFWGPISGNEIKSQSVANLMFDIAVNSGARFSILSTQEVLRDCFGMLDITLEGKIGRKTLDGLNALIKATKSLFTLDIPSEYVFLVQLTAVRMRRYSRLAKDGQGWAIVGWTQRAFTYLGSK